MLYDTQSNSESLISLKDLFDAKIGKLENDKDGVIVVTSIEIGRKVRKGREAIQNLPQGEMIVLS